LPDRFGNPEKVTSKEQRMVNREYTEIVNGPTIVSKPSDQKTSKDKKKKKQS